MEKIFGERLKKLRKDANLTQTQFAERINVHLQTVSKWERGVSEPDISQLGDIAAAFGITLEKLLGKEEAEKSYTGVFQAEAFGKMLSEMRIERGESQTELATVLQTSSDAVSRWERGVTCPDIEMLSLLADHFEVPVSKLYCSFSDAQAKEDVTLIKKRKRFSVVWIMAATAVLLIISVVAFSLWRKSLPILYTITVDGKEYSVSENDWFMPQTPERDGYDFVCWTDERGEEVSFPRKIEANCSFKTSFSPHEYTLDYWLNGGYFSQMPQSTFTLESGLWEIPTPEKDGAQFEGWYLSADYSGEPIGQIECRNENIKLFAKWSDVVYTIRYELNGGIQYGEANPESVTGKTQYELNAPVRKGYIFLGWYNQPHGGDKYENIGGENAKNLTLYALWQKSDALFTVFFDLNGGEAEGDLPVSVGAGEVHKLCEAEKSGYTFLGWNTQADGAGEYVDYLYNVHDTLHLYAIFTPKEYVIHYIFEGVYESEKANPNTIVYGDSVTLLPISLYGHEFVGWYDAETDGNKIEVVDGKNILTINTLYARFVPLEFELVLKADGGIFDMDGETRTDYVVPICFGEKLTLPECSLTGHDFLGWNTQSDGKGEFYSSFTADKGDLTLYAVYKAKEYLIRYEYDGMYESGKVNPNYILYGERVALYPVFCKGYKFTGWYDQKTGGNRIDGIDESNILQITVLYARFELLEFEVTFDAGGGVFTTPNGEKSVYTYIVKYGETLDFPIAKCDGYAFLGWRDEQGNQVEEIPDGNLNNIRLTASWLQTGVEYNLEYVLNGGVMTAENPETALSDKSVSLHAPEREGYIFLGWYDNADCVGSPYYSTPVNRTDDLTLYALWQEISVSGSAEHFCYQKTSSEVAITSYEGPDGDNVDLVIPSFVDGLPVTNVGLARPDHTQGIVFRSVTIPEGVLNLRNETFSHMKVIEPVKIPSTVQRIENSCFYYFEGQVIFPEKSDLVYIGANAFQSVRFLNTLVIPHGVKTIDKMAFYNVKVSGVILPDTVEAIFDFAFYQPNGYVAKIYIPSSVKYIGFRAVTSAYTSLSESQTKAFSSEWNTSESTYDVRKSAVTLIDGERTQVLSGEAFALPLPQKSGHAFLGWKDESGEFVSDCYIPNRDATLTAEYAERTEHDGRSSDSVALLDAATDYQFTFIDGQHFYFRLNVKQSCRILITINGVSYWQLYRVSGNTQGEAIQGGAPLDYQAGDSYYVDAGQLEAGTSMSIKIIILPL